MDAITSNPILVGWSILLFVVFVVWLMSQVTK